MLLYLYLFDSAFLLGSNFNNEEDLIDPFESRSLGNNNSFEFAEEHEGDRFMKLDKHRFCQNLDNEDETAPFASFAGIFPYEFPCNTNPKVPIFLNFCTYPMVLKEFLKAGKNKSKIDSLGIALSNLFKDRSPEVYAHDIRQAIKQKDKYFLLQRNVTYAELQKVKSFPVLKMGRYKGGFCIDQKENTKEKRNEKYS